MKRDLLTELQIWKDHPLRKPIILRGARQVGKSWLIDEFSNQFESFIKLDFEKDRLLVRLFEDNLNVSRLLESISLYTHKEIIPGKTLLFFDEIQECENAITALKYFKEDLPDLHVIAAGSLLDFVLQKIGIPVGRVQFLYLHPLSFGEFLDALEYHDLREHIWKRNVNEVIHEKILYLLKTYLWLGGMPAVVDAWIKNRNVIDCQALQTEILSAYNQDFYKYARQNQIEYVSKVFESIPLQLGQKFKFSNVDNEIRSLYFKNALSLLEKAGIAHICYHSSGQEQLLGASKDLKKFKVYFFDVGLAQRMLGLKLDNWLLSNIDIKTLGPIAEQLVAEEIIAYTAINLEPQLYYWHREEKSSNSEVDFLLVKNNKVIPVEVKSGTTGRMRSLHNFLGDHEKSDFGLKISEGMFKKNAKIEEIPLYGIEAWVRSEKK